MQHNYRKIKIISSYLHQNQSEQPILIPTQKVALIVGNEAKGVNGK